MYHKGSIWISEEFNLSVSENAEGEKSIGFKQRKKDESGNFEIPLNIKRFLGKDDSGNTVSGRENQIFFQGQWFNPGNMEVSKLTDFMKEKNPNVVNPWDDKTEYDSSGRLSTDANFVSAEATTMVDTAFDKTTSNSWFDFGYRLPPKNDYTNAGRLLSTTSNGMLVWNNLTDRIKAGTSINFGVSGNEVTINSTVPLDKIADNDTEVVVVDHESNSHIKFLTDNTERARIIADGKFGIGTTTPTTELEVNGTAKATLFSGNLNGHTVTATNYYVGSKNIISASAQGSFTDIELKNNGNTGVLAFGETGNMQLTGTLSVDTIDEKTSNNGVTIEGISLKNKVLDAGTNSTIKATNYSVGTRNIISAAAQGSFRDLELKLSGGNAKLLAQGDTGDMQLSGILSVDTINENTATTGVTIDGVLLKDSTLQLGSSGDNTIKNSAGSAAITLPNASTEVQLAGNLKLGGNIIKASDGTTAITTSGANVTIAGNLSVGGTSTTVNSTNTTMADTLIKLGQGLTESPAKDLGLIFTRGDGSTTNIANKALIWDESSMCLLLLEQIQKMEQLQEI